ncbi:MAG: four helix bundle protein [Planctomycetales bacterium]|nr:four helix bundle protein [Planctomycetales bacterium]
MQRPTPRNYRELDVWQRSMELVESVYKVSKLLPGEERFGLTSQMQRAAVSIPSNIAEGYGRGGKDYRRFVLISRGSLMEVETQLELSVRLGFIERDAVRVPWRLAQDVGKMLNRPSASLLTSE